MYRKCWPGTISHRYLVSLFGYHTHKQRIPLNFRTTTRYCFRNLPKLWPRSLRHRWVLIQIYIIVSWALNIIHGAFFGWIYVKKCKGLKVSILESIHLPSNVSALYLIACYWQTVWVLMGKKGKKYLFSIQKSIIILCPHWCTKMYEWLKLMSKVKISPSGNVLSIYHMITLLF